MEISKELKDISLEKATVQDILKDIRKQREEIHKKEHIFKALAIAILMEEMIQLGSFEEHGIKTIKMSYHYDKNTELNSLNFYLYGIDNKGFSKYNRSGKIEDEPLEPVKRLKEVFDRFHIFHTEEISKDFLAEEERILEIKKGVGDEILNLLLSTELKKILHYNKLKNELFNEKEKGKGTTKI